MPWVQGYHSRCTHTMSSRVIAWFGDGRPLGRWLVGLVATEARNGPRSATRGAGLALRAERAAPDDPADSPETEVLATEARESLRAAIGRLRDEEREVIGARYF